MMSEKEKLLPKRRFKEFKNIGAWEQRAFSEIFIYLKNNSLSRADLNYERGSVKNIHYGDVLIKFGEILDVKNEEVPYISNDEFDVSIASLLQNGDVIISDAAEDETVGKCSEIKGVVDLNIVSGLHTIPCRPTKTFASGYLGYYMNSNAYHDQLLPLIQGTKISSISKSALQKTNIIYPRSEDEQRQIGGTLRSLDDIIALHQHKLNKTKELKAAYLSEMFPAEGERKPKRRFAGFTDDWEQRKLEEVSKVYDGTHQTPTYTDSGIMFLSVENIKTLNSKKYISEEAFAKDFKIRPQKGDILMTRIGDIGTANVVRSDEPVAYYVSLALLKPIEIDSNFLATSIATQFVQDGLWKKTLHIAFPRKINKNEIAKVEINVPSFKEQIKIGTFFKRLDDTIALHQHKLEKLQNIKQAYLNEMFV